jgi:hypothetical protein
MTPEDIVLYQIVAELGEAFAATPIAWPASRARRRCWWTNSC